MFRLPNWRLLHRILDIGIAENDDRNVVAGKHLFNFVLLAGLLTDAFLGILLYFSYLKAHWFWIIFPVLNAAILLFGFYLNSRNKFEFNLVFTTSVLALMAFGVSISVIYFRLEDKFDLTIYFLPKIFFLLLLVISLIIKYILGYRNKWDLIVVLLGFFGYDLYILFIQHQTFLYVTVKSIVVLDLAAFSNLAVVIFTLRYFMFLKQRSDRILELQRVRQMYLYKDLMLKNRQITENITLASKFHQYVLTDPQVLRNYFSEYFLLFKPVMIVSGDFYYFCERQDILCAVIADSIGHGVSGACVSLYNLAILEFLLKTDKLSSPDSVFLRLNEHFKTKFSEEKFEAGVQMAVIFFDKSSNNLKIASNGLFIWILRKEQIILSLRRKSLGTEKLEYVETELSEDDVIYISTDGMVDLYNLLYKHDLLTTGFKAYLVENSKNGLVALKEKLEQLLQDSEHLDIPKDDVTFLALKV